MANWLVTGASGFLGRHVWQAVGTLPGIDPVAMGRRFPFGWGPRGFVVADLECPETLRRALVTTQPEVVIHAAGKTPPGTAEEFDRFNTRATVNLLGALGEMDRPPRMVIVGSAAELGPVDEGSLPVSETHPCRPADAYGWSKCLATCCGQLAATRFEVVIARVFNPVGPGLPAKQALGGFVARLLDPTPGVMTTGDLDVRRDFVDVRDVARALVALAQRGRSGCVYNVGTGVSHSVREGLDHLIRLSGRSMEVRIDPRIAANPGPRDSRADVRKIQAEVGWAASIPWETSLDDLWCAAQRARRLPLTG